MGIENLKRKDFEKEEIRKIIALNNKLKKLSKEYSDKFAKWHKKKGTINDTLDETDVADVGDVYKDAIVDAFVKIAGEVVASLESIKDVFEKSTAEEVEVFVRSYFEKNYEFAFNNEVYEEVFEEIKGEILAEFEKIKRA